MEAKNVVVWNTMKIGGVWKDISAFIADAFGYDDRNLHRIFRLDEHPTKFQIGTGSLGIILNPEPELRFLRETGSSIDEPGQVYAQIEFGTDDRIYSQELQGIVFRHHCPIDLKYRFADGSGEGFIQLVYDPTYFLASRIVTNQYEGCK
jgi:hypothetical protein